MITFRRIVGVALVALVSAATLAAIPAAAHHTGPEPCNQEVGIWTQSDRARNGYLMSEQMANVKVSGIASQTCKDGWASKWWKRTSTNYNVIDTSIPANDDNLTTTLDYVGYPVEGQSDYLNSRTTGQLIPPSLESVNLYVTTDGGVRVWFNGNLVINEWHDNPSPTQYFYVTPVLSPGMEYPVVIEYYHRTGTQKLQLHWKTASTGIVLPASMKLNGTSTQHSALHARANGSCTETVAYRISGGELLIWGYGCGWYEDPDTDPEMISLGYYNPQWVTLWQKWNGSSNPSTWGHWVYRWDTSQWVFIGNTGPRPSTMQGWLESSGYNPSAVRQTSFENYRENGVLVNATSCPETEDIDLHQELDTAWYGSGITRFYPTTWNAC